jgi:hypothetical protein
MLAEHDGEDRVVIQEPEEGEPQPAGGAVTGEAPTSRTRRPIKKGRE